MLIATVLCWTAWWIVITNIDPFQDTGVGFGFFYSSLFFAFFGTISLLAFLARHLLNRDYLSMYRQVHKSFRDSLIISTALTLLLYLQGKQYLNWWNTLMFFAIIFLILSFFWSNKDSKQNFIQ
ncbi:MAG: hypothetical protein A3G00_05070 [Candidatus Magasanikbacteria bacterium RIFCSPLOWO2_12_FULL_43_12]|uniref:Uncharacterized protein n=1 Tax=Candidatus Magasanikbacteria bacterium RIFCSPLOWO2_12_FULL_43_12 TaxID=1798692 RepID=A0A1F6MR49_9BACT|nr:MAG: hypothetical protein A3I93_04400 [Candidatus Magasanikbacteria bacterium RIFCSPLOWO2_02_FULL_43_22]OGH74112.1 MAG: hypothetical protein A3G00_05070 [Candidatus Magasanikbacteria bacterium RIFCSPLOWO2_12_FULL_43_12]